MSRGDEVAWLTIVHNQDRRYGAHDPRVCYESQGYMVEPLNRRQGEDGSPGGIEANGFRAVRPR
jgi:hypothetical protein